MRIMKKVKKMDTHALDSFKNDEYGNENQENSVSEP
jgi:hypothetical protein